VAYGLVDRVIERHERRLREVEPPGGGS
jgi:hypothetical protein